MNSSRFSEMKSLYFSRNSSSGIVIVTYSVYICAFLSFMRVSPSHSLTKHFDLRLSELWFAVIIMGADCFTRCGLLKLLPLGADGRCHGNHRAGAPDT